MLNEQKEFWIRQFIGAKIPIVPQNGKIPIIRQWQNSEAISDESLDSYLEKFGHLDYGVVVPNNYVVLDVDGANITDQKSWDLVKKAMTFGTLVFQTSRQFHYHIWFKKDPNFHTKKHIPQYVGLEFLSKGHKATGCGSVSAETGTIYSYISGDLNNLTDIGELGLGDDLRKTFEPLKVVSNPDKTKSVASVDTPFLINFCENNATPAVEGVNGNETLYRAACQLRDFGSDEETTLALLLEHYNPRCSPPWGPSEMSKVVSNAYAYAQDEIGSKAPGAVFSPVEPPKPEEEVLEMVLSWDTNKEGALQKTLKNAVNCFQAKNFHNILKYNRFSHYTEFSGKAPWHVGERPEGNTWSDTDAVASKYLFATTLGVEISTNIIQEAVVIVSTVNEYHPVRDYLESVEWDSTPRLDTWLIRLAGVKDNAYTRAVSSKCLMSAVARIYNPGAKVDSMLVLEGPQGCRKSSVVSILGGKWFSDTQIDLKNRKDTVEGLRGNWIIEMAEMEVSRKVEIHALRAFLTKTVDRERLAYAKNATSFARQCVFIGTHNPEHHGYLKDPTGGRRFWPVSVNRTEDMPIDTDALEGERDQLFAEAKNRYLRGEKIYIDNKHVLDIAKKETSDRATKEVWASAIDTFLHTWAPEEPFTLADIWTIALGGDIKAFRSMDQGRIANYLNFQRNLMPGNHMSIKKNKEIEGYKI